MKETIETIEDCKSVECEKISDCDNITSDGNALIAPCVFDVVELEEEMEHVEGGHIQIDEGSYLAQVTKCTECGGTGEVTHYDVRPEGTTSSCPFCHDGWQVDKVYDEQYIEDNLNQ